MEKILRRTSYVLGVLVTAAMLAGCGGGLANSIPAPLQNATQPSAGYARPASSTGSLLYVSNYGDSNVTVYSWPSGKLEETLDVPAGPVGECTNASGTVWITGQGADAVVEYAHGNTKQVAKLGDPGNNPHGCSLNPKNGDLAVTNINSNNGAPSGTLAIYAGAKGSPTIYQDASIYRYYFCGYDSSGNLYVDGIQRDNSFVLAELPSGASKLTVLSLKQSISTPGGVQWDGKHITVGDASKSVVYQFSVSGNTATVVGSTSLKGGDAAAYYIDSSASEVVALITDSSKAGIWKYPTGGSPTTSVTLSATDQPIDLVISE